MPKHIFETGGVVSPLGKGITAAPIDLLPESRAVNVVNHYKSDPLNIALKIMDTCQYGEEYVKDGGEKTDLEQGHYARFTGVETNRNSNLTAGRIYDSVLKMDRRGVYLGGTFQVLLHVTNKKYSEEQ
ncbi:CTP synthase [Chitinispirillum alkaliphilum]|nr:CTP synthase [Chitinispirillum alkaliphilum]